MKHFTISLAWCLLLCCLLPATLHADNGYKLWQRYAPLENPSLVREYRQGITEIVVEGNSPTMQVVREELNVALSSLLNTPVNHKTQLTQAGALVVGTPAASRLINTFNLSDQLNQLGTEGFLITTRVTDGKPVTVLTANTDIGVLYAAFHFIRLVQTQQSLQGLHISSAPRIQHRVLNHWDNLNRTVERGYAGFSLWDWHKLPGHIDQRYLDYARANASLGINGTVLTNVNANALVLTPAYLEKVAALANAFRPYGLKVYLTARFSAPIEIGALKTADPLDPAVQNWWKQKSEEIYKLIPDFGGFLVKANSEGQPGPQNYGRNHADGANMLADAVAPHGGIVMWRAFVYDDKEPDDRAKQAYNEFKPLDGSFRKNVIIQVKNGAIDFQPREPFHPLFGAMPQTPLMMEFQITQEYLGQSTSMAYLAPLFKETLLADTYAKGKGSTVAKVIDGSLDGHRLTGIAGVANIGTDLNWTGHHFGQANWYAFGRLAWDYTLTSETIAREWLTMTFTANNAFVEPVQQMMLHSREAMVNYMTPFGLHHIMAWDHHYGPGPWIKDKHRADWTSVYYHKASETGIGFDRTKTGSNALAQYHPVIQKQLGNIKTCPEELLLWFHHVKWTHKMKSGRTLWDELCHRYYDGARSVEQMQTTWNSVEGMIDAERFTHVKSHLNMQAREARWWRDACVLYFQTFSNKPIPQGLPKPSRSLEYYMQLDPKFVPGI